MKSDLRKKYSELRKQITNKTFKDTLICSSVINSKLFCDAEEILCYYPIKDEISTLEIIASAINSGKRLYLPVCTADKGVMRFYRITSPNELKTGKFGLTEPDTEICKEATEFSNALCIVPAYTYDYQGFRLGYGGGYYDRFLADFGFTKIGLCYDELISNRLPKDSFDIKVDYIITDKRIIDTSEED